MATVHITTRIPVNDHDDLFFHVSSIITSFAILHFVCSNNFFGHFAHHYLPVLLISITLKIFAEEERFPAKVTNPHKTKAVTVNSPMISIVSAGEYSDTCKVIRDAIVCKVIKKAQFSQCLNHCVVKQPVSSFLFFSSSLLL